MARSSSLCSHSFCGAGVVVCSQGSIWAYWAKKMERSGIRSLITGWCGKGAIWISRPGTSSQPWVQASVLRPPMFIAHEPQTPSRHERRNASVGSMVFLMWMSTSRSIGPHASTSTS